MTRTVVPYRPAGSRIDELVGESADHSRRGDWSAAVRCQRQAVELAGELADDAPDDVSRRTGLGGLCYRLGALHLADRDPAAAVAALDDAVRAYARLVATVPDAELSLADVLARRGLAQSVRGWAASAEVDADAAVLAYLSVTGGDPAHPRRRNLARVLASNAATLAPDGDPRLAIASANAALGYYGHADEGGDSADADGPDGTVDSGYVHSAAVVSALLNFVDGRVVEGFVPATVIAAGLPPGQARQALEAELRVVDGLLSTAGGPVPFPPEVGRGLARLVLPTVRDRGLLWVPADDWLDRAAQPALTTVVQRHAAGAGAGQATLPEASTLRGDPALLWTTSMRWLSGLPLEAAVQLAAGAVEVLPTAYADGRRLALAAHALLASAYRAVPGRPPPDPAAYLPVWQRLLEVATDSCRAAGDHALADDFDAWRARLR
ncbi:hypothetical protein EDC02_5870 [Micromonospora sp. Llam0]|uniref:hypothetical protein n=1 Tax=Micromonospora sp. Llam0 TaxID=2485143 RepID=UPI000F462B82|nr:hypothetical protein [Micromonospora sp. Llam0]ROO51007.1 hypothetical protein EDC02_5870 [Micromonospora sp. Llam0]